MREERSAGALIYRRDKSNEKIYYLLLKYNSGHWGFAKGNIEEGEDLKETTIREIKEEIGLEDIKFINGFKEKIEYYYYLNGKKTHKIVSFFLCETNTKQIRISNEHEGYKWATYPNALKMVQFKNSKRILKKAHKKITSMLDQYI
ncbi:MAG: NUDIX domain-containing protein [Candidatus Lokiarchaeota archaeon]|nr:NUDIX domain-containing protein [Candidatus Lokiarchaeota archaeon]